MANTSDGRGVDRSCLVFDGVVNLPGCATRVRHQERDDAVTYVTQTYGWKLELYGLERLRVLLATTQKEVVAQHPHIFCQPFFPAAGGLSLSPCPDHLVLDYLDADGTVAQWLARRLVLAGFRVWCKNLAPLAGSSVAETIKALIRTRAFRYLPVLSFASLGCPEMAARRSLAHTIGENRNTDLVLPLFAGTVEIQRLEQETRRLEGAHFESSWADGLKQVLATLDAIQCPRHPSGSSGTVLQSFMPPNVLVAQSETLAANIFPVRTVPRVLKRFVSEDPLGEAELAEARLGWAFRKVSSTRFVSFSEPPGELAKQFKMSFAGGSVWEEFRDMDGIPTWDIVKELLRRSLDVACSCKGLKYCKDRELLYFPQGLSSRNQIPVVTLEGNCRRVGVAGERSFGSGRSKSKYRYYLAPTFSTIWHLGCYGIIVRFRIRITDVQGNLLAARAALARRRDIGGTWWNDDWFLRVLGVMQFVSASGHIEVGATSDEMVVVDSAPKIWQVPVSINEVALQDARTNRDEIAKRELEASEEVDANG